MRESFRGDRILFFSHRIIEGMCPRIQEIWYSREEAAEAWNPAAAEVVLLAWDLETEELCANFKVRLCLKLCCSC